MNRIKMDSRLTLNQEAIVENYERLVLVANDLNANDGSLTKAISDVNGIINIMKGIGFPKTDIDIFDNILSKLNEAVNMLDQWQQAETGTTPWDLERYWKMPEGTLDI